VRNRQLALDAAITLLAGPDTAITVEAIAKKAGLGAATVVRAFGGKDALLDAAVSRLLEPVVQRARDLLAETTPYQALRTFLGELIAFQAAHHAVNDYLGGLDLPATTALRVGLVTAVEEMLDGARRNGHRQDAHRADRPGHRERPAFVASPRRRLPHRPARRPAPRSLIQQFVLFKADPPSAAPASPG
jgi:AcrR family transcriptional regulator